MTPAVCSAHSRTPALSFASITALSIATCPQAEVRHA